MKQTLFVFLLIMGLLISNNVLTVEADIGPHPEVRVDIKGLEGKTYYMTLLSEDGRNGPWKANTTYEDSYGANFVGRNIWNIFASYKDKDGYYYLGHYGDCSSVNTFWWNYYPPQKFKILIYLPEGERFIVSSDTYELYAIDNIYLATVTNDEITVKSNEKMEESTSTNISSFLFRALLTIVIEVGIALLFGYRKRKQLLLITVANVVTQVLLNVVLLILLKSHVTWMIYNITYILLEILIFAVEGIAYMFWLRSSVTQKKTYLRPWLYALIANLSSLLLGLIATYILPNIF